MPRGTALSSAPVDPDNDFMIIPELRDRASSIPGVMTADPKPPNDPESADRTILQRREALQSKTETTKLQVPPLTCRIGGPKSRELSITHGGYLFRAAFGFHCQGVPTYLSRAPNQYAERWGCESRGGAAEPPPRDSSRARAAGKFGASRV